MPNLAKPQNTKIIVLINRQPTSHSKDDREEEERQKNSELKEEVKKHWETNLYK